MNILNATEIDPSFHAQNHKCHPYGATSQSDVPSDDHGYLYQTKIH